MIIGIARCFTFGGSRNRVLHDPAIHPRSDLSKEQYMKKEEQTTVNHFHEKLLKLKDLMKTKVHIDCQVSYWTSFHGYSSFLLLAWPLLIVERHIINVKPLWITYLVIYQTWLSDIDTLSRLGRGGLREDTSSWRNFWKSSMKNGMDELDKR